MKAAVIVFPGSNCDRDALEALRRHGARKTVTVWHGDTSLPGQDLVVLPGGFSYGDYLRAGAIAARSPIMAAVREHARRGGLVAGICNGFQVLCEAGLLPGALMRNAHMRFVCKTSVLRVENARTAFTRGYAQGAEIAIPIAHHDGNYFADEQTLERLEGEGRVVFRYRDNPNGSARAIAGIVNAQGNVLGMMPHPERAVNALAGACDGVAFFESLAEACS